MTAPSPLEVLGLLEVRQRQEEQAQLELVRQEEALATLQSQLPYILDAQNIMRDRLRFSDSAILSLEEIQRNKEMLESLEQEQKENPVHGSVKSEDLF